MADNGSFKRFKRAMAALGILIVICIVSIYFLFFNEINTLLSIKRISENPIYSITYHGDYALDKYLATGAENWGEVIGFINENLSRGVGKHIYGSSKCSSFFATTPEGDFILARNLDTLKAIPSIIKTDTSDGYQTIGMTNFGRGGWNEADTLSKLTAISSPYYTLDGMNEHGLAIASLSVPTAEDFKPEAGKITIHDITVNRVILDKARNVEEAIALLSSINVKMEEIYPSHYMLVDAEGNSAVIEYIDGEMKIIKGSNNYQIATNFVLFNNPVLIGYSSDRYRAFDEGIKAGKGTITVEAALDLLVKNVVQGEEQWSVVYNLSKRTMAIRFYDDYTKTHHYSLN